MLQPIKLSQQEPKATSGYKPASLDHLVGAGKQDFATCKAILEP